MGDVPSFTGDRSETVQGIFARSASRLHALAKGEKKNEVCYVGRATWDGKSSDRLKPPPQTSLYDEQDHCQN